MVPGALGAGDHRKAGLNAHRPKRALREVSGSLDIVEPTRKRPGRPKERTQHVTPLETAIAAPLPPPAAADIPSWRSDALCAQTDPEEFFPPRVEQPAEQSGSAQNAPPELLASPMH